MKAIINAELVMRDHLIPEAVLFIEDGKIAGFGEMRTTPIPEGCEILDAEGAYVGPGLVDIHTHTGGDCRFWQDPIPCAKFHLAHGVTSVLPTSYPRMTRDEYIQMGDNIRRAMAQADAGRDLPQLDEAHRCLTGGHLPGGLPQPRPGSGTVGSG